MRFFKIAGHLIIVLTISVVFLSCKNNGNPASPPVPVKTELEGTWVGNNTDGIDQTSYTYIVALDSIIVDTNSIEKFRGTFTLDTATSPKQINMLVTKSAMVSDVGKTIPALYILSGNILKITANGPGSQRPPNLDSPVPVISMILQ
jgi:uncharacterized protein (TIGR03067 family)